MSSTLPEPAVRQRDLINSALKSLFLQTEERNARMDDRHVCIKQRFRAKKGFCVVDCVVGSSTSGAVNKPRALLVIVVCSACSDTSNAALSLARVTWVQKHFLHALFFFDRLLADGGQTHHHAEETRKGKGREVRKTTFLHECG